MTKSQLLSRAWRLDNLYWIQEATTGRPIPFRMNTAQRWLLANLHNKNVILKARQLGFSTLIMMLITDMLVFQQGQHAGVVAHKDSAARDLMRNKIKFALKRLPAPLIPVRAVNNETTIQLEDDSLVMVDTSHRSGTYQILHISEYGDISLRRPDAAVEIKTGALNTIAPEAFVFVESTGKGKGGEFYDMCKLAMKHRDAGKVLSPMDYKFHFFAWFQEPRYVLDPTGVVIPKDYAEYFDELRLKHGIELSREQQAWYVVKSGEQGDEMTREYPSIPDESFDQAIKGAYFPREMRRIREQRRITGVPHDARLPVHTAWDIGMDDFTAIWFFQLHGREIRVIDFVEENGEGLPHYANLLKSMAAKNGWQYGTHLGPHDIAVRDFSLNGESRADVAMELGLEFTPVPRCKDKSMSIESARLVLAQCYFDEERCARGIERLDQYRRAWDNVNGIAKATPAVGAARHAADAFQEMARGITLIEGYESFDPGIMVASAAGGRARASAGSRFKSHRAKF